MALVLNDRVKETSTTTGTGTLDLAGAATGFQTFVAGIGTTNTTYYCIQLEGGSEWEVGIGTVTDASTDTLSRDTVLTNSAGDTSKISFSAGTKNVFCTQPASKAVFKDGSNVDLADDIKLRFGTGNDLEIYHDASNSYVKDAGAGNLKIQGSTAVHIQDTSGNYMFAGDSGDAANLYFNNSNKLQTTNTGAAVTGTLSATTLTGDITGNALSAGQVGTALTAFSTGTDAVAADLVPYYDVDGGSWEKSTITNLALQGPTGPTGPGGSTGPTGPAGANPQLAMTWNSSTSDADPGAGKIAFNHATLASVTILYVDDADDAAADISAYVQSWDDSSHSANRGFVTVTKEGTASTYALYKVSGAVTDASGYTKVPVTHVVSSGSFSDTDGVSVVFARTGDDGSDGSTGPTGPTGPAGGFTTGSDAQVNSLGVNTAASGTAGEIRATNNITAYYSDSRLKDFEGPIESALDKVKAITGYYFKENQLAKDFGFDNDRRQVGVSAQQVETVLPEVITEAPFNPDYKSVWYEKLVPLIIEAIKELDNKKCNCKKDK